MNQINNNIDIIKNWSETIRNTLLNTYSYYGYINGLKDIITQKQNINLYTESFYRDIIYILQSTICLNIYKLLFDNGPDVYSLENYKKIIDKYHNVHTQIKKPKINSILVNDITNFRTIFIAHSIESTKNIQIKLSDLFDLLKVSTNYFNSLVKNINLVRNQELTACEIENCLKFSKNSTISSIKI